ncbi:MAG: aminotransferase class V-fold PLP-dependent enzyme, partial [Micavibrio aeruginosavorus]|nr:aminotransferase class V-fold PLP-dependent enzyme [Micavibrio aeruginosavorus]
MAEVTRRARNLRNNLTDAEKHLWRKLQHKQLGVKFRRQHPIDRYIVDFVNLDHGLIVEVDGGQHADNAKDTERTAFLESKGYKVIRFWNNEVLGNIEGVVETIMREIETLPPLSPLPQAGGGRIQTSPLPIQQGQEGIQTSPPPMYGRGGKGGRADWRADFPALQKTMNGKPVVFLDTGASAQKPQAVIDSMRAVMETDYANIHRGLYHFSQVTTAKYEEARR